MKIVFMGTPDHSSKMLEALLDAQEQIVCVVTQLDRPKGRGQKVIASAVKKIAEERHLLVLQPEKVKDKNFISQINSLQPDLIVIVAYGKILPKELLKIPKFGAINVHASLLPKYRGAAPIQWALLNGETETGVTIMQVAELLDSGDIILQRKIEISDDDNAETLTEKLFSTGTQLLLEAIEKIKSGKVERISQKDNEATYAPSLTKESGEIDWKKTNRQIHNRIRAMYPWPGGHTFYKGKRLIILKSSLVDISEKPKIYGQIVEMIKNKGFIVSASDGGVLISEVKPENSRKMNAYQFAIGHNLKVGDIFPS